MMDNDRIRQINELFYNNVNHKNMSELDMTTLKAMQAELDRLIRYREDADFKERTRKLKEELLAFNRDYPGASIRFEVTVEGITEGVDFLDHINTAIWTK